MKSSESTDTQGNPREPFRLSAKWHIYVPFMITAIPSSLFVLLGLVIKFALNSPERQLNVWILNLITVLNTLGVIAMAVVILTRYEVGSQELFARTNGRPAIWRKLFLWCSIALVLLSDIFTNLAVMFPDADVMLIPAAIAFIGYILSVYLAFFRL